MSEQGSSTRHTMHDAPSSAPAPEMPPRETSPGDLKAEIRRRLEAALTLHRGGRLDEAEAAYRQVLELDAQEPNALTNIGTIFFQRGQVAEGVPFLEASLKVKPDQTNALSNLAHGLTQLGRFEEAKEACERAVELEPGNADAWNNLGNARRELGDIEGGVEAYQKAFALEPKMVTALGNLSTLLRAMKRGAEAVGVLKRALQTDPYYVDGWNELGNCLQELGKHAESLGAYAEALQVQPDHVEALSNMAVALTELKRFDEALDHVDRALALRPDYADAWHNRGNIERCQKKFDEALADFRKSLELKPGVANAHNNIGIILHEQGQREAALAEFDIAQSIDANLAEVHGNRANVLRELNRFEEALAEYDAAIALKSGVRDAHNNRAICLAEMRRIPEAIAEFEAAARIDPAFAEAPWNKAILLIMIGRDAEGWPGYELRWKRKEFDDKPNPYGKKPWMGERDISGKVLLLIAEQGIGDTLQMLRYIPLLAAKGIRVVAAVQNPLVDLVKTMPGAWGVLGERQPIPHWDEFIPTMSLPLAFGGRPEDYPRNIPYLFAPEAAKTRWAERLGPRTRPRIALAWSGSREHKNDHNRSMPLKTLAPLLEVDAEFISLQIDHRERDLPLDPRILNLQSEIRDFTDTAAIIEQCDLVVSVDTSVAHLAGALGKPLWLLLPFMPDFRWYLEGDTTPWYPSATLWRQGEDRAWEPVIARLTAAAEALVKAAGNP
jgi:tetratricopeptide (TPR) repeat protein